MIGLKSLPLSIRVALIKRWNMPMEKDLLIKKHYIRLELMPRSNSVSQNS
jgi:hypothetical protein